MSRWQAQAQSVTIVRDDWGIAHIHGRTDADAVFGVIYAQAEDDFNRIETNYLSTLGRRAEAEGESAVYSDLRAKLFIVPADLKTRYAASPLWLKELMNAWADGLNYYLATHPKIAPRAIERFEPWMCLSFTEGSIGADIERVSVGELEAFYGGRNARQGSPKIQMVPESDVREHSESNGFAIAPSNTLERRPLLLINPHTYFMFRSEVQLESDEGLNVYGAVTWGQFFVYQGFNERAGWSLTSSHADTVDEYAEKIVDRGGGLYYRYGDAERPVTVSEVVVPYRTAEGAMAQRSFTVYRTHHGPVVREADGKWISVAMMYKPVEALSQSFLRMKARDYHSFREVAELRTNSLANTVFADRDGNIAYFHPNFIPRRDDRFDFTRPVDGSDSATDWQGEHGLDEMPHLLNPVNGWITNTNNWPYSAAGPCSPNPRDYPRYMDMIGENARGLLAVRILTGRTDFTLQSLVAAAYDSFLPAFAQLIPALAEAYDRISASDPNGHPLAEQVELLRAWDCRWALDSIATSLAIFWGEQLLKAIDSSTMVGGVPNLATFNDLIERTSREQKLQALASASDQLVQDFGAWRIPWGEINRFQRLNADIEPEFDDSKPSTPVPFPSSQWGSLASFKTNRRQGNKRRYGLSGNSFLAVVEFGDKVRALAVSAGGASGDPDSPHFDDQTARFAAGHLREVYFYPDELQDHIERTYHPGDCD